MDVDLTEQLKEAKVKYEQRMKDAAEAAAAATARREEADKTPSSGEVRRWQRSGRYSRKVSTAEAPCPPHLGRPKVCIAATGQRQLVGTLCKTVFMLRCLCSCFVYAHHCRATIA